MKELAQELYEAYCGATGGKSAVTGVDLPPWSEVGLLVQTAWRAVALYVERERIEYADTLARYVDALIWMSGSADFGPGGQAHAGFVEKVQPLIGEAR